MSGTLDLHGTSMKTRSTFDTKVTVTRLISIVANMLEYRKCVTATCHRHYALGLVRKRAVVADSVDPPRGTENLQ